MTRLVFTLSLLLPLLGASGCTPDEDPSPDATATLTALMNSGVQGTVNFTQLSGGDVRVEATLTGLSPGKHGMHVHEWGDCTAPDGSSAGGHFNPDMVEHGSPDAGTHHAGDFGNLEADAGGRAVLSLVLDADAFSLAGERGVLGRAIIVHELPDDFGQPTGNAGGRLACGVIQAASGDTTPVLNPGSA